MFNNRIFFLLYIFITNFAFSQQEDIISFSHKSGFYSESFYLKINIKQGELFYFDENNIDKNRKLFPDSLLIDKTTTVSLLVSHADSIHRLGSFTYFIRFPTDFKVVSISIDNDYLYNTYKGIYVKGPRAYFDTTSNHYRNVNWERKWERASFVEIFSEEGERIVGQKSGIKIFGGMTKYYPEKSLRLIARKKYGDSRFDADLFNQGKKKYKQFILRHSGNDYRKLRFKDALATSLASESGLDVQSSSPSHLFVNSEYWGVYNIREKINKYYIHNNYNCGTSGVDILQGFKTVEEGNGDKYNKLLRYIKQNDLSANSSYIEVQKMIDTRNFINFWVHQLFYANHDVRGNIRFWRSDSLDGKFRWIVYDTDLGFGSGRVNENSLNDFTNKHMTDWYNPNWATFLLRNLLHNNEFKKDFIHQSSFIFSSTLSSQHTLERLRDFKLLYDDEMKIHFDQRKRFQRSQGSYKKWEESINKIQSFFEERDEFSFLHLEKKFNLEKPYVLDLKIKNYSHGKIRLNNNELKSESFLGYFYNDFELPINIEPDIGYSYRGYLDSTINGKSGDTVSINIEFIDNKESEIDVIFNEVNYLDDCLEIYNREASDVNLSGWIIIDKNHNKYTIDNFILKAGKFAVLHFSDDINKIDSVDYLKIGFRFSSSDEQLSLYDNNKQMVDMVNYQLKDSKTSYSRNIPFSEFDGVKLEWENIKEPTIGFHNKIYTDLLESIRLREVKQRDSRRILIASVGGAILIPLLFFLIKRRRKK